MNLSICLLFVTLFASLVSAEEVEPNVVATTLVKSTHSWDGSQLPSYPEGQPEITILKIVIPARVKLPLHYHPYINAGVLTKGELTVVTKLGETFIMTAGDAIVEVVNKWHLGENSGDEPAEIIVFYAGIKEQSITVK